MEIVKWQVAEKWWKGLDFDTQFYFFRKFNSQLQYKSISHLGMIDILMIYEEEFLEDGEVYKRIVARQEILDMFEDYI